MRSSKAVLILLWLLAVLPARANPVAALPGGDFQLTDHNGEPFTLQQLRGKVVLLFFGYTYCPDICPTELAKLAGVFQELGDRAGETHGLFISLDPDRDTPAVLKPYVSYFSSRLIGLTGTTEEIDRVVSSYRASYRRHSVADGRYSLDHTANLYAIDRNGRLAAIIPYGLPRVHIVQLVNRLLGDPGR